MSTRNRLVGLVLAVCVGSSIGCYNLPPETRIGAPHQFSPISPEEAAIVGEPRWGLSLSGGGLRAALFAMGAMKGLYDAGVLDSVQIVSTVSGGSYAAYWLYSREYRAVASPRFGSHSFETAAFQVGVCDIATTGNFFTYGRALRTAVSPWSSYIGGYDYSILRTFGQANYDITQYWRTGERIEADTLQLHHLKPKSVLRQLPYLVVNATVVDPDPRLGWKDGLFEFTPILRGNEAYQYHRWTDSSSFPFRQAVAISGAAFRKYLKQTIPSPLPTLDAKTITLSDGGQSENLGALALIRRRVQNIIIVDAEHDPTYNFGAYVNLQSRLASWGVALSVKTLDEYVRRPTPRGRLQTAVHRGTVRYADGDQSTIYYMKMSLPQSLDSILADSALLHRGEHVERKRLFAALHSARAPNGDMDCRNLQQVALDHEALFAYEISLFQGRESRRAGPLRFLSHDFPQYTTADQSFNLDRSFALIGLGYSHARALASITPIKGISR